MEELNLICDVIDLDTSNTISTDNVSNVEDGEVVEENEKTEEEPIFDVIFQKNSDFNNLRHVVLKALENALSTIGNNASYRFSTIQKNNLDVGLRVSTTVIPPENVSLNRADTPDFGEDLNALFMIDTEPATKLDPEKVPSYKRTIKDVLDNGSAKRKKIELENICHRPRQASACFNCGKMGHAIRDCQKPRNIMHINRAKKAFVSKQERYHIDVEQRFAHLRPGAISNTLQAALGLRRGELPFFFYRMRVLGYPPGWLEDAKVEDSGISLFNSEGKAISKSSEDECETSKPNHKYDISKLIDFPGFNQNPGANFYDDHKHHNVPPISQHQMKDKFIKMLGENNIIRGYMRKKFKSLPSANINDALESAMEVADMEIGDADQEFTPPLPTDKPSCNNQSQQMLSPSASSSSPRLAKQRSQSPTLEDLEAQQQLLLNELQSSTAHNSIPDDKSGDVTVVETPPPNSEEIPLTLSSPKTPSSHRQPAYGNIIKESHVGTPLLKFSPFDKLPLGESFQVGVSDVINFENLPDSIGKYEQMKRTIKKVRSTISKITQNQT